MHLPFLVQRVQTSYLQPSLNLAGQGAEVAHALQFVVRQLDVEMILQLREQIQRLQAVDAESLKEIVVGGEFFARNLEVRSRPDSESRQESFRLLA